MLHARLVLMFVIENNEFSQALSLHLSDDPRLHPSSYTKQTMHKINPDHNFPLFDDLETKSNKIMFQLKRVGIFLETGKITFKWSTNMFLYKYLFGGNFKIGTRHIQSRISIYCFDILIGRNITLCFDERLTQQPDSIAAANGS